MKRALALSLLAALVIAGSAFGTVRAQSDAAHFNVQIWNDITHDYPVTGTMDLSYRPGGIVRGYYHPAGLPSFVPITGGRSGDHIWLTIGLTDRWTLDGHVRDDGKITGSARSWSHVTPYSFVATPG